MPRVTGGVRAHRRHKKIIDAAKGFYGSRSKLIRRAREATLRAGEHAFAGRRIRRRDLRSLWIARLSAALFEKGLNYSKFINGLTKANITLDRKILSDMAINDSKGFDKIVESAKTALNK